MGRFHTFIESAGILVATTIGAGVFALPYLFSVAGWGAGLAILAVLSALLIYAHGLYARVLLKTGDRHHLAGLARRYAAPWGFSLALVGVLGGLLLTLVAYLILAQSFVRLIVPGAPAPLSLVSFWIIGSVPVAFGIRRLAETELLGAVVMGGAILAVFMTAPSLTVGFEGPAIIPSHALEPFGATLFALASWTAIPPMVELFRRRKSPRSRSWNFSTAVCAGTVLVAALYALFVFGIAGSGDIPATDTVSNLVGFPPATVFLLGILGLFALWTSYVPIAHEIRDSFVVDIALPSTESTMVVLAVPLLLVMFGLDDFLAAVSLAGGVFLAAQYVLIMLVARNALRLRGPERFLTNLVIAAFAAAALYELWVFIVP